MFSAITLLIYMPNCNVFAWHLHETTKNQTENTWPMLLAYSFKAIYTHSSYMIAGKIVLYAWQDETIQHTLTLHFVLGYNYQKHYHSFPTSIYYTQKEIVVISDIYVISKKMKSMSTSYQRTGTNMSETQ